VKILGLERIFKEDLLENKKNTMILTLPAIWYINEKTEYDCQYYIPEFWKSRMTKFPIHHIQYRCLTETSPYMNVFNQNVFTNANTKKEIIYKPIIGNTINKYSPITNFFLGNKLIIPITTIV